MAFKSMFETERGSLYLRDSDTGRWERRKYDGTVNDGIFYAGSVDRDTCGFLTDKGTWLQHIVYTNIMTEKMPGFVPEFVVGYSPFGVSGSSDAVERCEPGVLALNLGNWKGGIHIGDAIKTVYSSD